MNPTYKVFFFKDVDTTLTIEEYEELLKLSYDDLVHLHLGNKKKLKLFANVV